MSASLLQYLVNLTELSTSAVLATLLLRPVFRRLGGSGLAYASWSLVPLVIFASLLPQPAMYTAVFNIPLATIVSASIGTKTADDGGIPLTTWILILWTIGVVVSASWIVWQQRRFSRSLGVLQPSEHAGVYFAVNKEKVGPLSLGTFDPRIVLPSDFQSRYTPAEQALILAHEQVHVDRRDVLANTLASALQIVFWFNPLIFYGANLFRLDQELACDDVVMQRNPNARAAYANAILKTQLVTIHAPMVCHWRSNHPLKERIMQLSQSTPSPARRRMAKTVLASVTLAACYGAWAADQAPANAKTATTKMDAQRYEVVVDFKKEVPGNTKTLQLVLAQQEGEKVQLFPSAQMPLGCKIDLIVNAMPEDLVTFKMPFQCDDDNIPREPRLVVKLGQTGNVGIGTDIPGLKFEYTIGVTIKPWPQTKPWPKG